MCGFELTASYVPVFSWCLFGLLQLSQLFDLTKDMKNVVFQFIQQPKINLKFTVKSRTPKRVQQANGWRAKQLLFMTAELFTFSSGSQLALLFVIMFAVTSFHVQIQRFLHILVYFRQQSFAADEEGAGSCISLLAGQDVMMHLQYLANLLDHYPM